VCRTAQSYGEAEVLWEETGMSTKGAPRGRGPGTYARIVEITSGRANSQQGLVTTCKDPSYKENEAMGGAWSDAWARMSYEGRVMSSEVTLEVIPDLGNTHAGQRGPGYSVVPD
jgi:hypothetical protein